MTYHRVTDQGSRRVFLAEQNRTRVRNYPIREKLPADFRVRRPTEKTQRQSVLRGKAVLCDVVAIGRRSCRRRRRCRSGDQVSRIVEKTPGTGPAQGRSSRADLRSERVQHVSGDTSRPAPTPCRDRVPGGRSQPCFSVAVGPHSFARVPVWRCREAVRVPPNRPNVQRTGRRRLKHLVKTDAPGEKGPPARSFPP